MWASCDSASGRPKSTRVSAVRGLKTWLGGFAVVAGGDGGGALVLVLACWLAGLLAMVLVLGR